jgi:hypothetical protein
MSEGNMSIYTNRRLPWWADGCTIWTVVSHSSGFDTTNSQKESPRQDSTHLARKLQLAQKL